MNETPDNQNFQKENFLKMKWDGKAQIPKESLPDQVIQVCSLSKRLFADNLSGILLYGSATLGGLRPDSDLDLLILIRSELTRCARETLTKHLLIISSPLGDRNRRPLEVTVLNVNDLHPWSFPPKCEYLYGEWLRKDVENGRIPQPQFRPDTVILLWQARRNGLSLAGDSAECLIPEIPFDEIRKAIRSSLSELISWFRGDERNVLLTLARMWFTLETGTLCAKDVAAEWVSTRLPPNAALLIRMAGNAYLGRCLDNWTAVNENDAVRLVDHLKQQIEKLLSTSRNPPVPESPEAQSCSKCSRNNNHSKVFK